MNSRQAVPGSRALAFFALAIFGINVFAQTTLAGTNQLQFATLTWDPGATQAGTQVFTNTVESGGDFYFKITAQNTSLGAWRTVLNVLSGEVNVYLKRGTPPTVKTNDFKSERVGSDGFVLPASAFNAGEDWYYLVRADPGSRWTLVSGEPFVSDLDRITADGSSGSGRFTVGPEGVRYFKTTTPVEILGWRLWLNGATNSILVSKVSVPVPSAKDLGQPGQMLVVPPYLASDQLYFVGVVGDPGAVLNLDSRPHVVTEVPFLVSTNLVVNGYGYTTFRLQVPVAQIAWQISLTASQGNPNLAVRRNLAPNESFNDAYSEAPGLVTKSITLVPPTLSDGTFYVTVYGTNTQAFTLQSGPPEITPINFVSRTTNADASRVGWRFFQVSDINEQLGALGWDLFLTNFAPGTRIALRRNAVPGLWNLRDPNPKAAGVYDFLSTGDFLQRPGHQADVWYVGVYNPDAPLGNFTLVTGELKAEPLGFDGNTVTRQQVPAGKWQFFQVDVPDQLLGWDLRLTDVASGLPQIVVRRELLPVSLKNIGFGTTVGDSSWPHGNQWAAGSDWTARPLSASGVNEEGRVLTMSYGRPLQAGTYYVGVLNSSATEPMSYTLLSRGIGADMAIPVQTLEYAGGSATNSTLATRDLAVYQVNIASNTPSWKVRLAALSGDVLLAVGKDTLPNITATGSGGVVSSVKTPSAGRKMDKLGNEHFAALPPPTGISINPGTYYLVVASEGQVTAEARRIGTGISSYVLQSIGPMPEIDLGTLLANDLVYTNFLEGGESIAFHFHNLPNTLGFELTLENRLGNPVLVSRSDLDLADPGVASVRGTFNFGQDPYGNEGGRTDFLEASPDLLTVSGAGLDETIMVKARGAGGKYSDARYTLRVRKLVPQPLAFDGGTPILTNQTHVYEFYQIEVPADAQGWDLRVTNALPASSRPKLMLSPELLPLDIPTPRFNPGKDEFWPIGAIWIADKDWTRRSLSADGAMNEDGRILAMGMGRPLEPGTYYAAVRNPAYPAPISYTILSRGIGSSYSIPVIDLPFRGGVVTNATLAPREAAYYRVSVPADAPSWQVRLRVDSGEAMLLALSNTVPSVLTGQSSSAGKAMQKPLNEQYLLLPGADQALLPVGARYLAVVSEVQNTNTNGRIGAGVTRYTLESLGPLPVKDLGSAGSTDLVDTNALQAGAVRAYQFTVPPGTASLQVQLVKEAGNPVMVLRPGALFPNPGAASPTSGPGSVSVEDYGNEGGAAIAAKFGDANTSSITVANPTNGVFTLLVKARAVNSVFTNAAYTLIVRAGAQAELGFDGSVAVTNQTSGTWRYFRIEVPTNALGWDLRLAKVTGGQPKLVVRRDLLPGSLLTTPWGTPGIATNWPSGNQWAAAGDWTRRSLSAVGAEEDGRILGMGMGQPLQPGTYYAGVINATGSSPMSYTLQSRGVGPGFSLPVTELAFNGGSVTNNHLLPRDAAYYQVTIPTNTPSWKVRLASLSGEVMLVLLKDRVPNVDSGRSSSTLSGKSMQKAGNEHYLLLPAPGQSNIAAGTYFLAVISEGLNPSASSSIGTASSSYVLASAGSAPVMELGAVGLTDQVVTNALEGGESRLYRFQVPVGTPAFQLRLENRVGAPTMVLVTNTFLPDPGARLISVDDPYGNEGGVKPVVVNDNLITIPNPASTDFTVAVKAGFSAHGIYPDVQYTLRLRQVPTPELNFSPELNTNGLANVASGSLLDNERAYFKVSVPAQIGPELVIGWELSLAQLSGVASMRVRKDALPSDSVSAQIPFTTASAILAPPVLTNGTWYVEVKGTNPTAFTFTSSTLRLQRPAWTMPGLGEPVTTPGMTTPDFGDSGVTTNGVPLLGDQGTDLEQGRSHYYAVVVPTNNVGLLRVRLDAISGNPDLYLRALQVPTVSHNTNGLAGTTLDRQLTSTVTDYGNWVPLRGAVEDRLTPGIWYLAVRAVGNANARYRLRLSTGLVQDLELNNGTATSQIVAGGDWRYYRVQFPSDPPPNWQITFSQQSGDVVLYLRDTVPPGNGATTASTDYKDWTSDAKNTGPYGSFDSPGTYTFQAPPLRPGAVYYLGFRAKSDSIFSVSSSTSGADIPLPPVIPFYGGSVTNVILPHSQVTYRVLTPTDALRWRHTSVHSSAVQVYIENGSYPTRTSADHFRSAAANSQLDRFLTNYPWLPNQTYFLLATNTSSVSQNFVFNLKGSSLLADDNNDGMPDAWEIRHFGTIAVSPTGDYDGDGVSNLNEFLQGTDPTAPSSPRSNPTVLTNAVWMSDGLFHFTILSAAGQPVRIDATTNLVSWSPLAVVTNVSGVYDYADPLSASLGRRFYRVSKALSTQTLQLVNPQRLADGQFQFTILGAPGEAVEIQAGPNLADLAPVGTATNTIHGLQFTDPAASSVSHRFYYVRPARTADVNRD